MDNVHVLKRNSKHKIEVQPAHTVFPKLKLSKIELIELI